MAGWYPHNRANDDGTNFVPDMPGISDFKSKPFEAMRTEQDQIWWLYWWLRNNTSAREDYEALEKRVSALEEALAKLKAEHDELSAYVDKIYSMLCALAQNALIYDVTRGVYAPSITTARRTAQFFAVRGMTVAEAATMPVGSLAAYTCREVAVTGYTTILTGGYHTGEVADQLGYTCADFNPDEYVKKSDLTLIDTDNLEAHAIMGVLEADAASDFIKPAPYVRPFDVYDLNNSYVRFDDVVVTDQIKDGE